MTENEYDDLHLITTTTVLYPKIRFAGISEKTLLLEMGKSWITDNDNLYTYNGMIYDVDTSIGANRHHIIPEAEEVHNNYDTMDTDEECEYEYIEIDDVPNMTFNSGKQSVYSVPISDTFVKMDITEPILILPELSVVYPCDIESIVKNMLYEMIDDVVYRCNANRR